MHQQPPKTPLLRSTSAAKASHVDSSSALTVYDGTATAFSVARRSVRPWTAGGERGRERARRRRHRRRRRIGRCGRRAAPRGRRRARSPARGRRPGRQPRHPRPRAPPRALAVRGRLGVRDGAAAPRGRIGGSRWPRGKRARRLELPERDDLGARRARGLRLRGRTSAPTAGRGTTCGPCTSGSSAASPAGRGTVSLVTCGYEPDAIHVSIVAAAQRVRHPVRTRTTTARRRTASRSCSTASRTASATHRRRVHPAGRGRRPNLAARRRRRPPGPAVRRARAASAWSGREDGRRERASRRGGRRRAAGRSARRSSSCCPASGRRSSCAAHGIDVVADLPGVGENLHDHLLSPVIFSAEREVGPPSPGLPACQTHLFWRSRPGLPAPDVQPIHFMVPMYEPWMSGPENGFTLMGGMIRPQSRGSLRLSGPSTRGSRRARPEHPLV